MAEMKVKFKCRCQNCHVYSLGLIRMLPIAMVSNVHVCWVGGGASKTSLRAGKIIQDKPMLTSISFFPFFFGCAPSMQKFPEPRIEFQSQQCQYQIFNQEATRELQFLLFKYKNTRGIKSSQDFIHL